VNKLLQLYKILFISILASYIYLGKGIAYGYFAEILLLVGILLLIKQRKSVNLIIGKLAYILYFLLFINLLYITKGILKFSIIDTIRDGFILNYIYFALAKKHTLKSKIGRHKK
jgi:hypothetical protein